MATTNRDTSKGTARVTVNYDRECDMCHAPIPAGTEHVADFVNVCATCDIKADAPAHGSYLVQERANPSNFYLVVVDQGNLDDPTPDPLRAVQETVVDRYRQAQGCAPRNGRPLHHYLHILDLYMIRFVQLDAIVLPQ